MLGSINQKSLHNCRVRFADHRAGGSIFPLFDNEGKTKALMLTSSDDDQLIVVKYGKSMLSVRGLLPSLRPQRFFSDRTSMLQEQNVDEDLLKELWHFDPWWVLGDERYAGLELVPALKETNLPGYDPTITAMRFTPSLSRVSWVTLTTPATGEEADGTEGPHVYLKRFRPEHLRTSITRRYSLAGARSTATVTSRSYSRRATQERGRDAWRLSPFWEA